MIGLVFIVLGIGLAAVFVAAVLMFLDVTFWGGDRIVAEREDAERRWRPPYARGADLVYWATVRARQIVGVGLGGERTADVPSSLVAKVHDGASRAMLPMADQGDLDRPVACPEDGQGVIGVSALEALALADYVRKKLPPGERDRIYQRSRENAARLANGGGEMDIGPPCSLQGQNCMCRAYSSRPLHCRPFHAATVAARLGLEVGGNGMLPPWTVHGQTVAEGIAKGVKEGLEAAGFDSRLYELNSALVSTLETPDAARRFMDGEDVFAGARLFDA